MKSRVRSSLPAGLYTRTVETTFLSSFTKIFRPASEKLSMAASLSGTTSRQWSRDGEARSTSRMRLLEAFQFVCM